MYIEFQLPKGDPNYVLSLILKNFVSWASKYNIEYRIKPFKYTLRVTFDLEESYTLFAMTWNSEQIIYLNYTLVEPMKTRQS